MSSNASVALLSLPPILPSSLLAPDSEQRKRTLPHCAVLLNILHARNRNQHHRSSWYRHYSVFRREVTRLCEELVIPVPQRAATLEETRFLKKRSKPNKALAERRLRFWVQAQLPFTWHQALTHLIATTQFSSLGLVLLGLLATVCALTGITTALESLGSVDNFDQLTWYKKLEIVDFESAQLLLEEFETQSILERFANEDAQDFLESQDSEKPPSGPMNVKKKIKSNPHVASHEPEAAGLVTRKKRKTKRKVNEAQDAIDLLFSGL